MASARHNIAFNLKDEKQKKAHLYLKKLGHLQASMISMLIDELLQQNGIEDVTTLTKEDAKELTLSKASSRSDMNRIMEKLEELQNRTAPVTEDKHEKENETKVQETEQESIEVITDEEDIDTEINPDFLNSLGSFH